MPDFKQLFALAALLLSAGFVIRSFQPAHAFTGPQVSLGSNPIESHYQDCNGSTQTIVTNATNYDFIVTDVAMYLSLIHI